jgi:hypothetical protein
MNTSFFLVNTKVTKFFVWLRDQREKELKRTTSRFFSRRGKKKKRLATNFFFFDGAAKKSAGFSFAPLRSWDRECHQVNP